MTQKLTYVRSLIPFLALAGLLGCERGITDPENRGAEYSQDQDQRLPAGELELLILPGDANLEVGDLLELRPYWQDGEELYDDPAKDSRWVSDDPAIASVTDEGLVLGLREGTVRIRVAINGEVADAMVIVRQP